MNAQYGGRSFEETLPGVPLVEKHPGEKNAQTSWTSWECKGVGPLPPSQGSKALLRDYEGILVKGGMRGPPFDFHDKQKFGILFSMLLYTWSILLKEKGGGKSPKKNLRSEFSFW